MLTPQDIKDREFLVSLRGYDKDEVKAFLDEVAEVFSGLLDDVEGDRGDGAVALSPRAADGEAEPAEVADVDPVVAPAASASPFAAIGAETQRILDAAQAVGEEIRARADAEAAETRAQALAADQEVAELREQAAAMQRRIDVLELRRDTMSGQLRDARETVEMALAELEDAGEADAPADA
ncbi:hypothetical protein BH23ACT9_BH23ACT9_11350 [soil metagenome]